jgi:hypothetical protein
MEVIMAKNSVAKITKQHNGDFLVEVKDQPSITFHYGKTSMLVRKSFEDFGVVNALMNAMAVSAGDNGKTDPAAKRARAAKLIEYWETGTDDRIMKAGPRNTGPDIGLLIKALIDLHGLADVDAANRLLDKTAEKHGTDRDAVVAKLWGAKDVVAWVTAHRLEARTFEINSDDFLAEMGDGG